MNHTPGQWEVFEDEIVACDYGNLVIAIVRPVYPLPYDFTLDAQSHHTAEANARLIASAPVQNKALEEILELVTHTPIVHFANTRQAIIQLATDAITKAKS